MDSLYGNEEVRLPIEETIPTVDLCICLQEFDLTAQLNTPPTNQSDTLPSNIDLEERFEARCRSLREKILRLEDVCNADPVEGLRQLTPVLDSEHQALGALAVQVEGERRHGLKLTYRRYLNDLWRRRDITRRVVDKPRGYHGDYLVMEMMYENTLRGSDSLGASLHGYVAQDRSSASVRARRQYLSNAILGRDAGSILVVASGPAREVEDAFAGGSRPHCVTLVDQDVEALRSSEDRLSKYSARVEYEAASVLESQRFMEILHNRGPFDLIYSAGLLDYLHDAAATVMIEALYGATKKGGEVLIGNFRYFPIGSMADLAAGWRIRLRGPMELTTLCPNGANISTRMLGDQAFVQVLRS